MLLSAMVLILMKSERRLELLVWVTALSIGYFSTKGGVFTDDQIDAYMELKWEEIYRFEHAPHPVEFDMYYKA